MEFLNTCTRMYMYIGADLVYNRIIEYRCGVGERREGVGGGEVGGIIGATNCNISFVSRFPLILKATV